MKPGFSRLAPLRFCHRLCAWEQCFKAWSVSSSSNVHLWQEPSEHRYRHHCFSVFLSGEYRGYCTRLDRVSQSGDGTSNQDQMSSSNGEKIVREALRMVLEAVYEPYFLVYSHGYRPGKGYHSALKEIRRWVGINWFIRFRPQSYGRRKMREVLMHGLQELIGDDILLSMIGQTFGSDKKETDGKGMTKLSRLLTNIYLHQFDIFVARTITLYRRGEVPTVSRRFQVEDDESSHGSPGFRRRGVRHIMIANLPEYRRLWYVRHGTEFLMGFIGTRDDARDIFFDSKYYLRDNLGLNLNEKKRGLADTMENPASFLGFHIVCEDPILRTLRNPNELEWRARMRKLNAIKAKHQMQRIMRKYNAAGRKALVEVSQPKYRVPRMARRGYETLLNEVMKNLKETIVGPEYRNIYYIVNPREILLNRRTQKIFPVEITEAAKQLEQSLKAFVESNKNMQAKAPQKPRQASVTKTITPPEFYAPINTIRVMLGKARFLLKGRPTHHPDLFRKSEGDIVLEYTRVATCILNYYKCARNLDRVKRMVDYNLRFSCLRTLGAKHKTTAKRIKSFFSTDLVVPVQEGKWIALRRPYPSSESLIHHKKGFLSRDNPPPPWIVLKDYC